MAATAAFRNEYTSVGGNRSDVLRDKWAPIVVNEGVMESPRPPPKTDAVGAVSGGCYGLRNSNIVGSIVDDHRRQCCLQVGQIC